MKTLDTVKIMDIPWTLIPLSMLAAIAILNIGFIRSYMDVEVDCITIYVLPFFMSAYARKRVFNRVIHNRKDATFPINPDSKESLSGK